MASADSLSNSTKSLSKKSVTPSGDDTTSTKDKTTSKQRANSTHNEDKDELPLVVVNTASFAAEEENSTSLPAVGKEHIGDSDSNSSPRTTKPKKPITPSKKPIPVVKPAKKTSTSDTSESSSSASAAKAKKASTPQPKAKASPKNSGTADPQWLPPNVRDEINNKTTATKGKTKQTSAKAAASAKKGKVVEPEDDSDEDIDDEYDDDEKESLRSNLKTATSKLVSSEPLPGQDWCLWTYAVPDPSQPFKGVYGIVKCLGTFQTEKGATKKATEIISDATRTEIKVLRKVRTGAWVWLIDPNQVPANKIDMICTEEKAKDMQQQMNNRMEQKAKQDAAKTKEKRRQIDEQDKQLDIPGTIEYYAMKHVSLRQVLAAAAQLEENIVEMQKEIKRLREEVKPKLETQIAEMDEEHPDYKGKLEDTIKSFVK